MSDEAKAEVEKIPADSFIVGLARPAVTVDEKMATAVYEAALLRMRAGVVPTVAEWKEWSMVTREAFARAGDTLRFAQAELIAEMLTPAEDKPPDMVREALEAK